MTSSREGQEVGEEVCTRKVMLLNQDFLSPIFLQINFCRSLSHESLIISQRATIKRHNRLSVRLRQLYYHTQTFIILQQPYIQILFLWFHAIVCYFLVNDTWEAWEFEKKNGKVWHVGRKNTNFLSFWMTPNMRTSKVFTKMHSYIVKPRATSTFSELQ